MLPTSALLHEDYASVKVCVDADSQKEHVKRRHRKDNRRRKWEATKLAKQSKDSDGDVAKKIDRGDEAVDKILKDLLDFDRSPGHEKTESEKEVYQNIAERVHNEQHDYQGIAAEIAVPDPHHPDLPGHGMLIEFCTSADSAIGRIGHQYGVHVIRCTEKALNADDPATEKALLNIVKEKPGIDLHGSLPCGPWDPVDQHECACTWREVHQTS